MNLLLSWKYNFVFIHIPKTGGTALTDALAPYARLRDRAAYGAMNPAITLAAARIFGRPTYIERIAGVHAHAGLPTIEDRFGTDAIAPLIKASFVRNPFTRTYSLYAHIKRTQDHPLHKAMAGLSFCESIPIMRERHITQQTPYLLRRNDIWIAVDFLGYFERMDADAQTLSTLIGLPRPLSMKRVNANPGPAPNLKREFGNKLDDFIEANLHEFNMLGYSTDIDRAGEPPIRQARMRPFQASRKDVSPQNT